MLSEERKKYKEAAELRYEIARDLFEKASKNFENRDIKKGYLKEAISELETVMDIMLENDIPNIIRLSDGKVLTLPDIYDVSKECLEAEAFLNPFMFLKYSERAYNKSRYMSKAKLFGDWSTLEKIAKFSSRLGQVYLDSGNSEKAAEIFMLAETSGTFALAAKRINANNVTGSDQPTDGAVDRPSDIPKNKSADTARDTERGREEKDGRDKDGLKDKIIR